MRNGSKKARNKERRRKKARREPNACPVYTGKRKNEELRVQPYIRLKPERAISAQSKEPDTSLDEESVRLVRQAVRMMERYRQSEGVRS